jgi:hypothetical protein
MIIIYDYNLLLFSQSCVWYLVNSLRRVRGKNKITNALFVRATKD